MKGKAPYVDYQGGELHVDDYIEHPNSDDRGRIVFLSDKDNDADRWRVDYEDGSPLARLCLQVGDKGQAVKSATK